MDDISTFANYGDGKETDLLYKKTVDKDCNYIALEAHYQNYEYSLYPNYSPITERADYLSLNEKEWTDPYENIYPAGSVFVANRNIRPFECYIKTNTATKAYFPLSNDAATRSAQKTVNKIPQKHDL